MTRPDGKRRGRSAHRPLYPVALHPLSQCHSTGSPSPKRYGTRYEGEDPVRVSETPAHQKSGERIFHAVSILAGSEPRYPIRLEAKHLSDGRLLPTYQFDRPNEPKAHRRFERSDLRPGPNRHERAYLYLKETRILAGRWMGQCGESPRVWREHPSLPLGCGSTTADV